MTVLRKRLSPHAFEIVQQVAERKLSYRKGAAILNKSPVTLWRWVRELQGRPVDSRGRAQHPIRSGKVPRELRARLTTCIEAGEITYSEAALIADVHVSCPWSWMPPSFSRQKARDNYLRQLFPDILGQPKSTAPERENQAKAYSNSESTNV